MKISNKDIQRGNGFADFLNSDYAQEYFTEARQSLVDSLIRAGSVFDKDLMVNLVMCVQTLDAFKTFLESGADAAKCGEKMAERLKELQDERK